nr:uncharacterized protein LOC117682369 [Crassostrea gigas]
MGETNPRQHPVIRMEQGQQCADPLQSKEVLDSQHYRQSVTENKARQGRRNFNCSVLGNTVMVSGANEDVCSSAHKDSEQLKDIEVTESAVCDSLASQQTPPPRLSCVHNYTRDAVYQRNQFQSL